MVDEKKLYLTKWHDYKILPIRGADLYFISKYADATGFFREKQGHSSYGIAYVQKIDLDSYGKFYNGALVKLRQWADERGMKYGDFWDAAFLAFDFLGFKKPFPNVFTNRRLLDAVMRLQKPFIRYAEFDFFRPENYFNHQLQNEYYDYLVESAMLISSNQTQVNNIIHNMYLDGKISGDYFKNIS